MRTHKDSIYNPIKRESYKIQIGDELSIEIRSLDPTSTNLFNLRNENINDPYNSQSVYLNSYRVNNEGSIKVPILGSFKVSGFSIDTISSLIERAANEHVKEASVFVKLTSFKVSILGEVKKPGTYDVYDNKLTVLKALGMAGDLTDYGNRRKIKIVRDIGSGYKVYIFDLTSDQVFLSEHYCLYPNDVVYVEPIKLKPLEMNLSPLKGILSISAIILALRILRII